MSVKTRDELEAQVMNVSESVHELVASLPNDVKPRPFAGFGVRAVGTNHEEMHGWDYDWSDKGDDPPPWADWSNKSE